MSQRLKILLVLENDLPQIGTVSKTCADEDELTTPLFRRTLAHHGKW
jgi:hypothetical protein